VGKKGLINILKNNFVQNMRMDGTRDGVQITHNRAPNSVVLVAPDGTFFTEATVEPRKIILDDKFPKHPRLKRMFEKVDPYTHAERYLSL
jgi:hypothetical protein